MSLRRSFFGVVLTGGVLGLGALYGKLVQTSLNGPAPKVHAILDGEVTLMERSGQTVRMAQLQGKVVVMAHLYTVCHHGCAAVLAEMHALKQAHGGREDFQLVSVAVVPERDTPTFFHGYAESVGVKAEDPWWFLSGDSVEIKRLMTEQLGLEPPSWIPEDERLNPLETHAHDLRMVLIDRQQRVRGYYALVHPQKEIAELMRERLRSDVSKVLNERGDDLP